MSLRLAAVVLAALLAACQPSGVYQQPGATASPSPSASAAS